MKKSFVYAVVLIIILVVAGCQPDKDAHCGCDIITETAYIVKHQERDYTIIDISKGTSPSCFDEVLDLKASDVEYTRVRSNCKK